MALKFRLRGLAETFLDEITCPCCGTKGNDDEHFVTDFTKVTLDGIVVVVQCRDCGEIFVPDAQRLGILNLDGLKAAVERDCRETGDVLLPDVQAVKLSAEKMNASRKGELH